MSEYPKSKIDHAALWPQLTLAHCPWWMTVMNDTPLRTLQNPKKKQIERKKERKRRDLKKVAIKSTLCSGWGRFTWHCTFQMFRENVVSVCCVETKIDFWMCWSVNRMRSLLCMDGFNTLSVSSVFAFARFEIGLLMKEMHQSQLCSDKAVFMVFLLVQSLDVDGQTMRFADFTC